MNADARTKGELKKCTLCKEPIKPGDDVVTYNDGTAAHEFCDDLAQEYVRDSEPTINEGEER